MSAINTEVYSMFDAAEIRGGFQRELDRLLAEEEAATNSAAACSTSSHPPVNATIQQLQLLSRSTSAPLPALQHIDHSPNEMVMSEAASHIRVHVERIAANRQLLLEEDALKKIELEHERRAQYDMLRASVESEEDVCRRDVETEEASLWESHHKAIKTERTRLLYQERMRAFAVKQATENAAIHHHDLGTQGGLDALLAEEYAPYKGANTSVQRRVEREERTQFWDDLRRKRTFPLFERDLAGNAGPSSGALSSSQVDWHHPRAMRTNHNTDALGGSVSIHAPYIATSPYDSRLTDAFMYDS